MTRNLKALGLALVAAFAFSAMAASGASAQFLTSDGSVTLKMTQTGESGKGKNAITAFGGKTECDVEYKGHKYKTTELLEATETLATFKPKFGECTTINEGGTEFPTTVDMNGCDYVVHPGDVGAA